MAKNIFTFFFLTEVLKVRMQNEFWGSKAPPGNSKIATTTQVVGITLK